MTAMARPGQASLNASFSYIFPGFWNPTIHFSGALRAPYMLHFLRFSQLFEPKYLKFPRRTSRSGTLHFPKVFQAFGARAGPLAWDGELRPTIRKKEKENPGQPVNNTLRVV